MAELDRWLKDLVRSGLANVHARPNSFWDAMAARLVDAQAPRGHPGPSPRRGCPQRRRWPGKLLAHIARLHLLAAGWSRLDWLSEAQRANLRTAAGGPRSSEHVLAGERESDRWLQDASSVVDRAESWAVCSRPQCLRGGTGHRPCAPGCGALTMAGWPWCSTSPVLRLPRHGSVGSAMSSTPTSPDSRAAPSYAGWSPNDAAERTRVDRRPRGPTSARSPTRGTSAGPRSVDGPVARVGD